MLKPPTLEVLDAQVTGAIERAKTLDKGLENDCRALLDRLRDGADRSVIAEALREIDRRMTNFEETRSRRG